jgi:peroxiredoxin
VVKLSHWRGRRVLLIFFNPQCGFCEQMAPQLSALKSDGSEDRPIPVVITTGDADANRRFMEQHGIRCPVLVQRTDEVMSLFQVGGTPMGYLVDEDGAIATPVTVGAEALLALAAVQVPSAPPETSENVVQEPHGERRKGKVNRGLHTSRLRRDGLKAGTPAPPFRLPRLDGGELALEDLRGRRVLLVFSDPECGPCSQLAPDLEQLHRGASGVAVVMISRRDAEANRRKVAELGLTFPVVLQRHWEISLLYGMFATPIAYLIDAQGILVTDVVVGEQPIRDVLATAFQGASASSSEGNGRKVFV